MGHGVCGGLRPEQRSYASVNSKRSAFLERVSKPVSRPSRCGHRWATLGVPKGRLSFAVAMPADSEAVLKHALSTQRFPATQSAASPVRPCQVLVSGRTGASTITAHLTQASTAQARAGTR